MAAIDGNQTIYYYQGLTQDLYNLSDNMHGYSVDFWPPHASDSGALPSQVADLAGHNLPLETATYSILSGHQAHCYLEDYYYRVHILPNPLALGNILTDQSTNIEVWSAFFTDNIFNSITAVSLDNVDITNGLGLATFKPLEYRIFSVAVSRTGSAILDGYFLFDFGLVDVKFYVTGIRVIFWSFCPSSEQKETRQYLTDIIQSIDSEQFYALRDAPRTVYSYEYVFRSVTEYTLAKQMVAAYSHIGMATPIWSQATKVKGLAAGSTVLTVNTAPLEIAIGSLGVLYRDYDYYEVIEVLSFTTNTITFKLATLNSFLNMNCWFMPVTTALNERNITFSRSPGSQNKAQGEFTSLNSYYLSDYTGYETYNGLPVISNATVSVGELSEFHARNIEYVDFQVGDIHMSENESYTRYNLNVSFKALGQLEIFKMKRFLDYVRGRANYFYIPTFSTDAVPTAGSVTLALNANQISVESNRLNIAPPKYIRVIGDTTRNFQVTSVTLNLGNTETIGISPNNPAQITNIKKVQILSKVRSNSDNIEIEIKPSQPNVFNALTTFPVIEVA